MWSHHFEAETDLSAAQLWPVLADIDGWASIDQNIERVSMKGVAGSGAFFELKPKGGRYYVSGLATSRPRIGILTSAGCHSPRWRRGISWRRALPVRGFPLTSKFEGRCIGFGVVLLAESMPLVCRHRRRGLSLPRGRLRVAGSRTRWESH
jgi:hypothetical protein